MNEPEITEADQIDPVDVMTEEDLDEGRLQALYRESYRDRPEPDDSTAFEAWLDAHESADKNREEAR